MVRAAVLGTLLTKPAVVDGTTEDGLVRMRALLAAIVAKLS